MARGALFIGVNKTGDLPVLKDAAASASKLHAEWATHQSLGPAELITDDAGPVTADGIQTAIEKMLEPGNLEQLVVYFAGHGINVRMGEHWLLSDAPKKTQAAVNVRGTEYLARFCGVPHVVFISDACRTAADTINAQNVTGTDVFPNEQLTDTERPVDLFYACALGRPAYEARDVNATANEFKGIYTFELSEALCFRRPEVVEWSPETGEGMSYIRPRKLRDYMRTAVTRRIRELNLEHKIIQIPDAHISSDPDAWLSRQPGPEPPAPPKFRSARAPRVTMALELPADLDKREMSRELVGRVIDDPDRFLPLGRPSGGPQQFETQCGFKIFGAQLAGAWSVGAILERLDTDEVIRVRSLHAPEALALFVLVNGTAIVVPAIREFIATLTIDQGELTDVAYEPSENTNRGTDYAPRAKEVRALRQIIGRASREGTFRLNGDQATALAQRMQSLKGSDPTLGLYAAHAYSDLHRNDLLREIDLYMTRDIGASLFDVAMLAGRLDRKAAGQRHVLGFAPLLSQGWASLRARRIGLPKGCEDLHTTLTESLWTMFNAEGAERLRSTIFSGATPWQRASS